MIWSAIGVNCSAEDEFRKLTTLGNGLASVVADATSHVSSAEQLVLRPPSGRRVVVTRAPLQLAGA